ncbi:hypothetical protein [uncultured Phyllobacterium sp.]|uniref:hypothetical protein n=1 Tax=uncultured Phyllobacterium sp. TaxID=253813 RepID=UPI002589865B|nr:hypothetical protein [uncultured Phyllobacterium sp.]
MTRYSAIRMFMFAFALLGLLLGPMAVFVSGAAMADQNMPVMMGMGDKVETAGMPIDMSCCPEKQVKVPDCSKDCPLNVLCVASFSSLSMADVDTFSIFGQKDLLHPAVFEALASRIGDPPHRPPSI